MYNIEKFVVGALQSNSYLLWNDKKEALLFDIGSWEFPEIISFIQKKEGQHFCYPSKWAMRGSNLLNETRTNTVFLFLENSCAMNLPQLSFFLQYLKKKLLQETS